MAYYHRPNNQRASSSAFAWGRQVHTKYATGCLRKILIQSRGYDVEIDPKYGVLGALNEARHAARLTAEGVQFVREAEFERQLTPTVTLSGHADFAHMGEHGNAISVDELKSASSKNTRRDVIRQGHWVVENLAQLVCYMSAFKVTVGRLIYTYYEPIGIPPRYEPMEERIFHVTIDGFGRIHVDSEPTKYTVQDLYAHQMAAARVIATGEVTERPLNWDALFVTPCGSCAHKDACAQWDEGHIEGSEAFVKLAFKTMEGTPK